VKEASSSSQSFSEGHKRLNRLEMVAILLFICGFFLSLSVINFIIGLLNDGKPIWAYLGVSVFLSISFITIVWGMQKIRKRGYIFDPPVVYSTVNRKYVSLHSNPRAIVFNKGNNRVYIAIKNSIIVLDDTINDIVYEILLKDPGYMAVDHIKDKLFVTLERGIAVIDTSSNTLIKNIFKEFRFGQLCINFNTNMLYAINLDFNCVYIIDCSSDALIDKIYCDSYPYTVTVNSNTNSIYIGNSDNTVTIIDGSTKKVIFRIHLPNSSDSKYGSTTRLDELYLDPLNEILYIKVEIIGPPNQGGASLHTSFFKIHLSSIYCPEYFIHDSECDIIAKTERYMTYHLFDSVLPKHDIFERVGSLDDFLIVNSESGLLYLTDKETEKLVELDSNNNILRTFIINHNCVSMAMNPIANKLYLANSGYFTNWIDIFFLEKEPG
jgi:hypothetical protein